MAWDEMVVVRYDIRKNGERRSYQVGEWVSAFDPRPPEYAPRKMADRHFANAVCDEIGWEGLEVPRVTERREPMHHHPIRLDDHTLREVDPEGDDQPWYFP